MARIACALVLALACAAGAEPRYRVCAFSFNEPDELAVFRAHLPPDRFDVLDLSPHLLPSPDAAEPASSGDGPPASWLGRLCRPDLQCDVVIYTAEFAGRFFGRYGRSLSLQEMEEASCNSQCRGLFHQPREVFLLACNTMATKSEDSRTPREYLQVLLDHGFDRPSAERAVQLRYGPLGPSFREALRRIFMGVPHVYGFASVAPRGHMTAPRLEHYLRTTGDYARHLDGAAARSDRNAALLAAFAGTGLVETSGLQPSEPAAADRDLVCAVYDESRSVQERLRILGQMIVRRDFLSFVPTMQVFLGRHPPADYDAEQRELFEAMQHQDAARDEVLRLVADLNVSAIRLDLAHLATRLGWMTRDDFRRLSVDDAKQLLDQPLTSEVVDIMCEIATHEPIGDAFTADDLGPKVFQIPEGLRLIDCLQPRDPQVTARLLAGLDSDDEGVRLWAAYALSRRRPLDDAVLRPLAAHLASPSNDVRERLRWMYRVQVPLSAEVLKAVAARDPGFAAELREAAKRNAGGKTRSAAR